MEESKLQNLMGFKERLVGFEFENPIIDFQGKTIDFKRMQKVFKSFEENGWEAKRDYILGCINQIEKDFGNDRVNLITDSGAGNLEVAMPPKQNIEEARVLYRKVYDDVLKILKTHNLTLAVFAIQPGSIPDIRKFFRRNSMYLALEELDSSDSYANFTSTAISAHQAGVSVKLNEAIDYSNEMIKIAGLVVALCGNSPIHGFKLLPWKEWRIILIGLFRFMTDHFGFERLCGFPKKPYKSIADYFRYYWETQWMILPPLRKSEWILPDQKLGFIEYFKAEKIPAHSLKKEKLELTPSADDLNLATICMWPHAKPHIVLDPAKITVREFMKNFEKDSLEEYLEEKLVNCYIECRAAAAPPRGEEAAIPALMLGLVNNMDGVKNITKLYKWEDWGNLVLEAAAKGLDAKIYGKSITPYLKELLEIAQEGLKKRGLGEKKYLEPFARRIQEKKNPADINIELFKQGKQKFLDHIIYRL